ncbi:hypothetical protein COU49_02505 [Candidatus Nomurabacteria bacterium CG10_big_fil_rev_8_21_14_0_10_35_16]|uniref:DUF805 domain-containing protein n=1 Tax=Candidatus Nomurabacteria bacterium CG10_big_fil_rev_8_21_14_0_10_35_16 TaxID=1974731 RepID=A0A2H0TB20_9BACT|nr:MAG: hypothetical protein COU49_02505 [Candidatus Nomurabacteria bacterium CG10_big_fil_rev_8_21_14_0_10_35_16]
MKNIWQFLGLTQERIGRRRFLIAFFSAQWGLPLAFLLVTGLFYLVFGEDSPILFLPAILFFASLIFGFVVYIKICIRRVRDIGIARSWWVLAIIPFINIPFFIYLCLKKGTTRQLTDDSKANPFTQQFKLFFAQSYAKPLIIVCFCIIIAGILYAGFTAYNLKSNIDTKIQEREEEVAREVFKMGMKQATTEYYKRKEAFENCLLKWDYVRSKCVVEMILWESWQGAEQKALNDSLYKELHHIKEISTFKVFTESFDRFNFGWLGVTVGISALIFLFLINILIAMVKFLRRPASMFIRTTGTRTAQTKDNINKMPAFQRYLLLIALLILITLVFVLIKL